MDTARLEQHARELLDTADIACVTTIAGDGRPQSRGMFNLRNRSQFPALRTVIPDGSFETWFTTNTSSSKMADLAGNRAISVYYSRPAEWRGLMLGGNADIVEDPGHKRLIWHDGWELYYPQGPDDPDYTVFRLRPSLVKYYHQLQTIVLAG